MGTLSGIITELGTTRRGLAAFGALGVVDGSVLPLPIEPFVLPVMASHPRRAPLMAAALLAGCLVGCLLFYLLGYAFEEAVVEPILAALGQTAAFEARIDAIRDEAFATLFLIGFSPVPLQIGTLGAGVAGVDLFTFLAALTLARGLRFSLLAAAAMLLGLGAEAWFARHQGAIVLVSLLLGAGGAAALWAFGA